MIGALRGAGVEFDQGLQEHELTTIERTYGITFPTDLRSLLGLGLPVSGGFPNWRRAPKVGLLELLARPIEDVRFDILKNAFWLPEWGPRPDDPGSALAVADAYLAKAPKLIPIYLHRYLPEEPPMSGNPVFSVMQTDVVYYGMDLADFFSKEFNIPSFSSPPTEPRQTRFWSRLADVNTA